MLVLLFLAFGIADLWAVTRGDPVVIPLSLELDLIFGDGSATLRRVSFSDHAVSRSQWLDLARRPASVRHFAGVTYSAGHTYRADAPERLLWVGRGWFLGVPLVPVAALAGTLPTIYFALVALRRLSDGWHALGSA